MAALSVFSQEVDYWCVRVIQPQLLSYNGATLPHNKLSRIELRTNK